MAPGLTAAVLSTLGVFDARLPSLKSRSAVAMRRFSMRFTWFSFFCTSGGSGPLQSGLAQHCSSGACAKRQVPKRHHSPWGSSLLSRPEFSFSARRAAAASSSCACRSLRCFLASASAAAAAAADAAVGAAADAVGRGAAGGGAPGTIAAAAAIAASRVVTSNVVPVGIAAAAMRAFSMV